MKRGKQPESVYTEDEWTELEDSVKAVQEWKKTGFPGSLTISRKSNLEKKFTPTKIKRLRKKYDLTQEEFAKVLNASIDTVRAWEQNKSHPRGTALKLLAIFEKHPEVL